MLRYSQEFPTGSHHWLKYLYGRIIGIIGDRAARSSGTNSYSAFSPHDDDYSPLLLTSDKTKKAVFLLNETTLTKHAFRSMEEFASMGFTFGDITPATFEILDMFPWLQLDTEWKRVKDLELAAYREKVRVEDEAKEAQRLMYCNVCRAGHSAAVPRIVDEALAASGGSSIAVVDIFFMFLKGKAEYLQKGNFW